MTCPLVQEWLFRHTALEPSLLRGAGFEALIEERARLVAQGSESAYIDRLESSGDELERLTAGVAVPETWLFRYPASFELLTEALCRHRARGSELLRMCSLGCAAGQEPYSMAITALHAGWPPERVGIDALDCNTEALAAAVRGRYGPGSIRGGIPPWGVPFLEREEDSVVVPAPVRSMVRFTHTDVLNPGPNLRPEYDIVFCRNVMIYLNTGARERLLRLVCERLAVGGTLFVGHAEPFVRGFPGLRPVAVPHTFALERVPYGPPEQPAPTGRSVLPAKTPATTVTVRAPAPTPVKPKQEPSAESNLESAVELADAGRMDESAAMVHSFIARHGPSAQALELLGMIRMSANDPAGARKNFEQAIYLEPSRTACLLQLALISESTGNPKRASTFWDRARKASGAHEKESSA